MAHFNQVLVKESIAPTVGKNVSKIVNQVKVDLNKGKAEGFIGNVKFILKGLTLILL